MFVSLIIDNKSSLNKEQTMDIITKVFENAKI
jgi:hypothetical protein